MCNNGHEVLIVSAVEPSSFHQANRSDGWRQVMRAKLDALLKNQASEVVVLPARVKPISCKWVYQVKENPYGSVNKFKARLVARGFLQVFRLDYYVSFVPMVKVVTMRLLIAYVVQRHWHVHQMDINNTFFHGKLEEDIYLVPSQEYEVSTSHVCRLKKVLYGLKQEPR